MRHRIAVLICLLLFSIASARGEEAEQGSWYEVEIILFQHLTGAGATSETWPGEGFPPPGPNAVTLREPGSEASHRLLPEQRLRLAAEARRLEKSREYRLLAHFGWRQPGLEKEQAPAVLIYPYPQIADLSTLPATLPIGGYPGGAADTPGWYRQPHVLGAIKLIRSRFLHLDVDLFLNRHGQRGEAPVSGQQTEAEPARAPAMFRLQEIRRMRSSEIHYFDHPRFGMIAVVRPAK